MKRVALALVLAILASCNIHGTAEARRSRVDPLERAMHNTVELQTRTGRTYCTGVVTRGVILTAAHCVADGRDITWAKVHGKRFLVVADSIYRTQDVAVVVPASGEELGAGVPLASQAPTWADPIWVIGHSQGIWGFSITKGIVSHPRRVAWGQVWMQHDAGAVGGNSGGPVLNSHGELVGIHVFTIIGRGPYGRPTLTHIKGAVHWENLYRALNPQHPNMVTK